MPYETVVIVLTKKQSPKILKEIRGSMGDHIFNTLCLVSSGAGTVMSTYFIFLYILFYYLNIKSQVLTQIFWAVQKQSFFCLCLSSLSEVL